MERMIDYDYKPQERRDLEELYRKQNVRINELEQENKKLREEISKKNMETWFDEKANNIFIDKS
jgi:cell shape-determining protein MreC